METVFYRLPTVVRAAITISLMFVATFGVLELMALDGGPGDVGTSVLSRLVTAAAVALTAGVVIVIVGDRRLRRTFGSLDRAVEFFRALRTGELPVGAEPTTWRGWLDNTARDMRWTPILIGVFAVVAVLNVVSQQWPTAALFGGLAVWFVVVWWVRRKRVSRLATAIERAA